MTTKVLVPLVLRSHTKGLATIEVDGATVQQVMEGLVQAYPGLKAQLLDDEGSLRQFVNLFLNDQDIRMHDGMDTQVPKGSVIEILPAIAGGSTLDLAGRARQHVDEMTVAALSRSLKSSKKPIIIDVRASQEWEQGVIPGALMIDRGYLEFQIQEQVPDIQSTIVCYCASGARSLLSAYTLSELGYLNVSHLSGGFGAWTSAGYPVDQPQLLSHAQKQRYARHLAMPEVGEPGQIRLLEAKVLCIGAGGLGSPAAMYLAAAGVGTIGIADDDVVELSNLQRQLLHSGKRVGQSKTKSARKTLLGINSDVQVIEHKLRVNQNNILDLIQQYDLVVDGSDNFETRYIVNDGCVELKKPFVHGSVFRFDGQVTTFLPGCGPCYRCLYPQAPPRELAPSCSQAGVLGVLPGVIGVLCAVEAIKLILDIGNGLVGRLISYDALAASFRELSYGVAAQCPNCASEVETAVSPQG